jgi:hypothetical protein
LGDEINSTRKIKEGSACLPVHSGTDGDTDILPGLELSHLWGAQTAGVNDFLNVQIFIEYFTRVNL